MSNLTYSDQALTNLKHFHRKKHIIYVEGQDDIPFWSSILKYFNLENFILKIAGGDEEIEKFAKSIIDFDTNIVVARDCDYSDLLNTQYNHPRILYTFGYSIENSLYRPTSISSAIAIHARIEKDEELIREAEAWVEALGEKFKTLIELDVTNKYYDKGLKVIPNTCHQFIKTSPSIHICKKTVDENCSSIILKLEDEEAHFGKEVISKSNKPLFYLLRGHFITNAIIKFIENNVRKIRSGFRISEENLFGFMMSELEKDFDNAEDINYIGSQVQVLKASVK